MEIEEGGKDVTEMKTKSLSIDELLDHVGNFGRFQKIINVIFFITMFPSSYQILIMSFAKDNPRWRCITNSTTCLSTNKTYGSDDNQRCDMPRSEWEYVKPRSYSIVTEFDLVCDKEWLIEFPGSVFFFGFIFGAAMLGYCTDNFGRRKVHYLALAGELLLGFLNIFIGNIYLFIVCRFLIGFFAAGTYPLVAVMVSEIVGNEHRALCNNLSYLAVGFSFSLLALKGYLLPNWKWLFISTTVPYYFIFLTYKFVPESVRFLRVKGQTEKAMEIFRRMAYWNKTEIPSHFSIEAVSIETGHRKTNLLDLFRTAKMATISSILGLSSFANSMAFYCVYLAAGDITGHMYRDFVIITILDVPISLIATALLNRFGRKKVTQGFMLIGSVSCLALGFTPKIGNMKILRLFFGILGKTCVVGTTMARAVWALELFPTHIRGGGVGLGQVLNKIGATSSAWIDKDMSKIYQGGAFILIGAVSFVSFCFQLILPETKGIKIADTENEMKTVITTLGETGSKNIGVLPVKSEDGAVVSITEMRDMNGTSSTKNSDDTDLPERIDGKRTLDSKSVTQDDFLA